VRSNPEDRKHWGFGGDGRGVRQEKLILKSNTGGFAGASYPVEAAVLVSETELCAKGLGKKKIGEHRG